VHAQRAAEEESRRAAAEQATRETETNQPERLSGLGVEGSADRPAENLPVYSWLRGVAPARPEDVDWPRGLVRAKEAAGDEQPTPPE
jgi:hypothetical protein